MIKRVHVFIYGKVQRVNFRYYIRQKAIKLGLNGWVRNRVDGGVEAAFEGKQEKVDEMLDFCKQGPERAEIEDFNILKEDPRNIQGFVVLR